VGKELPPKYTHFKWKYLLGYEIEPYIDDLAGQGTSDLKYIVQKGRIEKGKKKGKVNIYLNPNK
jgi:hypothetical protein